MGKESIFKRYFDNVGFLDIIIFIIVALFFHLCYGLQIINPTNINWIMSVYHDWGQHYLGWAFYRNDPWTFPLGAIESYNYPVGTNIGFMDSIPLLGLLIKPFSSILPEDFQYLGFWLFVCSYFVAYYTKKILQLYKVSNLIIILAVVLMIANPVLLFRSIHPALSSHFLILGSIYNFLRPSYENSKKINLNQIFLFFIAVTVNPYIMVMIFGFNVIIPLKHYLLDKTGTLKQTFLYPTISGLLFIIFWVFIGMIEFSKGTSVASAEPFSLYSFNLNSFFDSYGYYSKFLPDLGRTNPFQYEGFAYFGIGMMILIFFGFINIIFKFINKKIHPQSFKKWGVLLFLCLGLLAFSITNVVSFNSQILVTFPLPKIIEKLGFIFRASGRFVWPFYYLLFIGSIVVFSKIKMNSYLKITILTMITIVQLYDIQELYTRWNLPSGTYKTALQDERWIEVFKKFDNIIIYPSFDYNYSINYNNDYQDLSYLGLKAGKPISNGYVARANVTKANEFNSILMTDLSSGIIDSNRLFITADKHINAFDVLLNEGTVDIHKMDNFVFIYKKNKNLSARNFGENFETKKFLDSVKTFYKENKVPSFEPIAYKLFSNKITKFFFDAFSFENNTIKTRGWAILEETTNNEKDMLFLILQNDSGSYEIKLKAENRPDITAAFNKQNLDNAGFNSVLFTRNLPKGAYVIGLVIKSDNNEKYFIKSDKNIIIK